MIVLGIVVAVPAWVVAGVAVLGSGLVLAGAVLAGIKLAEMGIQAANAARAAYQAALGTGAAVVNAVAEPVKLADGGVASAPPAQQWNDGTGGRRTEPVSGIEVDPALQSEYDRMMRDSSSFRAGIEEVSARGGHLKFGTADRLGGWANTTFNGQANSMKVTLDLDRIDKSNSGGAFHNRVWAHQHSYGEFMAHELGHALNTLRSVNFVARPVVPADAQFVEGDWSMWKAMQLGMRARYETTGEPGSFHNETHSHGQGASKGLEYRLETNSRIPGQDRLGRSP